VGGGTALILRKYTVKLITEEDLHAWWRATQEMREGGGCHKDTQLRSEMIQERRKQRWLIDSGHCASAGFLPMDDGSHM